MAEILPLLLTIPETATALRIDARTVYRLIADGDLETVDVSRSGSRKPKTRVKRETVHAFIKARTAQPKRRRNLRTA